MKKQIMISIASGLFIMASAMTSFAANSNTGWTSDGDTWYYLDNSGNRVTDCWKPSGSNYYYLGDNGTLVTNQLVEDNSKNYYVDATGAMVKNTWVAIPVDSSEDEDVTYRWYYFGNDGTAYHQTGSTVQKKKINGKDYAFDSDGKMLFGFVDESGSMVNTNTDPIVDSTYYFGTNDDGAMHTGWLEYTAGLDDSAYDDKSTLWFYYNTSSGKKTVDTTKNINGKKYAFDTNGAMISEWNVATASSTTAASIKYYSKDVDGSLVKNSWVHAIPGEDVNAEDHDNDEYRWFYTNSSGNAVTNVTKKINGKWYAFADDGIMKYGFISLSDNQVSGSHIISTYKPEDITVDEIYNISNLFYFSDSQDDGAMKTGSSIKVELSDDTYTFAFNKNGSAYQGIKNSKLYKNGVLQTAKDEKYKIANDGNDNYYVVNNSGTILKAGKTGKDDSDCYFAVFGETGDLAKIAKFSGDDASKAASYWAKNGTMDGFDTANKYNWTQILG